MSNTWTIVNYFFAVLFLIIGILNAIIIHIVPGIFYILLSLLYFPFSCAFIEKRLNIKIPNWLKLVIAILILWGTLGVGDLMEYFEAHYL